MYKKIFNLFKKLDKYDIIGRSCVIDGSELNKLSLVNEYKIDNYSLFTYLINEMNEDEEMLMDNLNELEIVIQENNFRLENVDKKYGIFNFIEKITDGNKKRKRNYYK